MKPNRFLAVPSAPRYVGEEGCGAGLIPELRISKLLKTSRFLSFLKAKNNDGSWVWLKPEVQEGDAITQDSIRPEKIAKPDAEERDRLKFTEDCEAAKNESSGRKAFELYQDYKQRGIQIDGESAYLKFLEIAAEKGCDEAKKVIATTGGVNLNVPGLASSKKEEILKILKNKVKDPNKVIRLLDLAVKHGVNPPEDSMWHSNGVGAFAGEWQKRCVARDQSDEPIWKNCNICPETIFCKKLKCEVIAKPRR